MLSVPRGDQGHVAADHGLK